LIKDGVLPENMGKILRQSETIRHIADYSGDPISANDAQNMVEQAQTFVAYV